MWIRITVALAIILPAMFVVGGPWYVTFAIATVGFGTGRLVEAWLRPGPHPMDPRVARGSALALALVAGGVVVWAVLDHQLAARKQGLVEQVEAARENLEAPRSAPVLTLGADGTLRLDGEPLDDRTLADRLAATPPGTTVWLSSDPAVPHSRLVEVMDMVSTAGREVALGSPRP